MTIRNKGTLTAGLLALALALAGAWWFRGADRAPRTGAPGKTDVSSGQATLSQEEDATGLSVVLTGLDFTGNHGGKPVLRVRGARLATRKKKMRYFRMGLAREVVVQNAEVDLYAVKHSGAKDSGSDGWACPGLFSSGTLSGLAGKGKAEIYFEPVVVRIQGEGAMLSEVRAKKAALNPGEGILVFEHAAVTRPGRGDGQIAARKLALNPAEGIFSASGNWTVGSGADTATGREMRADLALTLVRITP
jgi:hypothetical protein